MLVEVLAAHLPAYTKMVVKGNRGGLSVPLTLGPACIARVIDVAPDVFHVAPGDVVVDTALLDAGGGDEILVGWVGLGGSGAGSDRTDRMRAVWHDGVFAERALCAKETLVKLPGAENYPEPARQRGIEGAVFVSFIVERDGSITSVNVVKGLSPECDASALQVVEQMPKWIPGKHSGEIVRSRFVIPIKYKLAG